MLDLGWMEMAVICVIALIILGPKELPRAIRTVTQLVAKARGLANEFKSGLDDIVQESELKDLKKDFESYGDHSIGDFDEAGAEYDFQPDAWRPGPTRLHETDRTKPQRKRQRRSRLKDSRARRGAAPRRKIRE